MAAAIGAYDPLVRSIADRLVEVGIPQQVIDEHVIGLDVISTPSDFVKVRVTVRLPKATAAE